MTEKAPQVSEETLHAYVDGLLNDLDRARVEAYLQQHPAEADRVSAYQRQNAALRKLGAAISQRQGQRVFRLGRNRGGWRPAVAAACAAGLLLVGGLGGWWGRAVSVRSPMVEPGRIAAMAHEVFAPQKTHPVEIFASDKEHLNKWLSNCLQSAFVAPEFAGLGYTLVGGRLLIDPNGPAALVMYQQASGAERIILMVDHPQAATAHPQAAYQDVRGVGTFSWRHGPLQYTLAGNLPQQDLRRMATAVNQQVATRVSLGGALAVH